MWLTLRSALPAGGSAACAFINRESDRLGVYGGKPRGLNRRAQWADACPLTRVTESGRAARSVPSAPGGVQ